MVTALFIGWNCGADSEGLADVTLDRLAKKLNQGEKVRNFTSYSLEIARFVYKEYGRDRVRFRAALRELRYLSPDVDEPEKDIDVRRDCQKMCVERLPSGDYQLVVDYYLKKKKRSVLAAELGIPLATLRTKIHRLNLRLAKCAENVDDWPSSRVQRRAVSVEG